MKPEEFDILELIPQRPPMLMIDRLIQADDKSAAGSLYISDSNVFCENGYFQEGGLVEFIAQTAAAFEGYRQLMGTGEMKTGFIASIKNLSIHFLPEINTEIQSEIIVDSELLGFTIITGKVIQNNSVAAECEMRILVGIPDNK
jgi:predicted hotdog family 3-hydroxylacyl-ACP dehydratase